MWQIKKPWTLNLDLQLNKIHKLDAFIFYLNFLLYVLYYHFLMFNKHLDSMLFVCLTNCTHAQYHQINSSQNGRVRKKRFLVQCTGDPKTIATGSWLENENRSSSGRVRSAHMLLCSCFIISSLFTAVHSMYCLSKLITPGYWFISRHILCITMAF